MDQIFIVSVGALAALLILALVFLFGISRKSQKVMESLLLLLTRPERAKIQDAARVLRTVLSGEMERIENNFHEMQEILKVQIAAAEMLKNDLGAHNEILVSTADEAAKKISIMTQRLENTTDGFHQIVNSNEWNESQKAAERFASRINELMRQVDTVSTRTIEKTGTLQNQINGWIESGKVLHVQLQSDTDANRTQMNSMISESEKIHQTLVELSASVANGFAKVKIEAADYNTTMQDNDKLMGSQVEKMEEFTKKSKTAVTNQMNILTNTANVVGGQIRLAESSIEKQVRKLTEAADTTMEIAVSTEESVRNISTELSGLTGRFQNEIKEFATGIGAELNNVSGVANTTLENTKTAAGAFSESVRAMAIGVRETLIEMNEAHTHLSGQSAGLIKLSAETTAQLQPLSELIEKYYTALPDLSQNSAKMGADLTILVGVLNDKIAAMRDTVSESMLSISDSSLKLEHISGQSRQQMIDLLSDYAKAVDTMQTLNKQMAVARATAPMDAIASATPAAPRYAQISSEDFIKQSTRLIATLNEQSVDLTRSIGAEIPDTIWKKYHAGDKTIFSKWLVKILTSADKKKLRDLVKSDAVFRSQSTQFVRSFAKMLNAAEQSDNQDMLTGTLLGTDLGAIYIILKNYM